MVRRAGVKPWSTVEEGAAAILNLAVSPAAEGRAGLYFNGLNEARAEAQETPVSSLYSTAPFSSGVARMAHRVPFQSSARVTAGMGFGARVLWRAVMPLLLVREVPRLEGVNREGWVGHGGAAGLVDGQRAADGRGGALRAAEPVAGAAAGADRGRGGVVEVHAAGVDKPAGVA